MLTKKLPPRFELGLVDSKSTVITATPRELNFSDLDSNRTNRKAPTLPTELPENDIDININIYIILLYKKIYIPRGLEPRTFGS